MQQKPVEQEGPQQDWAHYTDMAVGDILRRTRAYYNLHIEDVERALRIRSSQLMALEEGQVEKLPGRVYAIGFVRAYSEFLGLDGDKMVHLFKAQLVGHKPRPELNFPVPASESKIPNLYVLGGALGGLVLLIVAATLMSSPHIKREIPNVPAALQQEVASSSYGPPAPEKLVQRSVIEPMGPFIPESRITINALDNAWVEIRNGEGKALMSRILKQGDSYIVPNAKGLVMDTGNIGVLEFTVDGAKLPKLGENGDVRRAVPLDPSTLKTAAVSAITPAAGDTPE